MAHSTAAGPARQGHHHARAGGASTLSGPLARTPATLKGGGEPKGVRHGRPDHASRGDRLRRARDRARLGVDRLRGARVPRRARPTRRRWLRAGDRDHARVPRHGGRRSWAADQGDDHWEADAEDTRLGGGGEAQDGAARWVTTRWRASSTWTTRASTSPCSTRPRCSRGSRRPTSSAPRVARTTTGCTTTARPTPIGSTRSRSSRCRIPTPRSPRCAAPSSELGAKAVMIRPAPYIAGTKLNDPAYDPFWAAAAALDCPIGVHPSPHGDMANSCRLLGLADGVVQPDRRSRAASGAHQRDRPPARRRLLHPRRHLRAAPEPARRVPRGHRRLDRADAAALRPPVRDLRQLATSRRCRASCSRRQCMVSFDPDEVALAFTAEHLGAEQDPLGVRLPASRRQDPRRRRRALGRGEGAARRVATPDRRRQRSHASTSSEPPRGARRGAMVCAWWAW